MYITNGLVCGGKQWQCPRQKYTPTVDTQQAKHTHNTYTLTCLDSRSSINNPFEKGAKITTTNKSDRGIEGGGGKYMYSLLWVKPGQVWGGGGGGGGSAPYVTYKKSPCQWLRIFYSWRFTYIGLPLGRIYSNNLGVDRPDTWFCLYLNWQEWVKFLATSQLGVAHTLGNNGLNPLSLVTGVVYTLKMG